MLQTYTSLAEQWYPRRWWFAGVTALTFLLLLALMFTRTKAVFLAVAASGPAMVISWGFLCMCVWFHPTLGKLYTGRFFGRLPNTVQGVIRWYFVVFLTLWFVAGVIVWPVFVYRAVHGSNNALERARNG